MRKRLVYLTIAVAFLFASSPLQAGQECIEMLEQNCTSCHYKTRICAKIGKKNKRSWQNTVKRMIRYGLKINKSEQGKITDCLVSLGKNPEKFCD